MNRPPLPYGPGPLSFVYEFVPDEIVVPGSAFPEDITWSPGGGVFLFGGNVSPLASPYGMYGFEDNPLLLSLMNDFYPGANRPVEVDDLSPELQTITTDSELGDDVEYLEENEDMNYDGLITGHSLAALAQVCEEEAASLAAEEKETSPTLEGCIVNFRRLKKPVVIPAVTKASRPNPLSEKILNVKRRYKERKGVRDAPLWFAKPENAMRRNQPEESEITEAESRKRRRDPDSVIYVARKRARTDQDLSTIFSPVPAMIPSLAELSRIVREAENLGRSKPSPVFFLECGPSPVAVATDEITLSQEEDEDEEYFVLDGNKVEKKAYHFGRVYPAIVMDDEACDILSKRKFVDAAVKVESETNFAEELECSGDEIDSDVPSIMVHFPNSSNGLTLTLPTEVDEKQPLPVIKSEPRAPVPSLLTVKQEKGTTNVNPKRRAIEPPFQGKIIKEPQHISRLRDRFAEVPSELLAELFQHADLRDAQALLCTCKNLHAAGLENPATGILYTRLVEDLKNGGQGDSLLALMASRSLHGFFSSLNPYRPFKVDPDMASAVACVQASLPAVALPFKLLDALGSMPLESQLAYQRILVQTLGRQVEPYARVEDSAFVKFIPLEEGFSLPVEIAERLHLRLMLSGSDHVAFIAYLRLLSAATHQSEISDLLRNEISKSPSLRHRFTWIFTHIGLGLALIDAECLLAIVNHGQYDRTAVIGEFFRLIQPFLPPPGAMPNNDPFPLIMVRALLSGTCPAEEVPRIINRYLSGANLLQLVVLTHEFLSLPPAVLQLTIVPSKLPLGPLPHPALAALRDILDIFEVLSKGKAPLEPLLPWQLYFVQNVNGYCWSDEHTLTAIWQLCSHKQTHPDIIERIANDLYWDQFFPLDMLELIASRLDFYGTNNSGPLANAFLTRTGFYFFSLLLLRTLKAKPSSQQEGYMSFAPVFRAAVERCLVHHGYFQQLKNSSTLDELDGRISAVVYELVSGFAQYLLPRVEI